MPRISRSTAAAPVRAPAGSPASKRKAAASSAAASPSKRAKVAASPAAASPSKRAKVAASPAAASPSKRATLSNRRTAPAAAARRSGAARCVAELAPHSEFNSSGLGSYFQGSSAPRKRVTVSYDIDPHRSRRKPRNGTPVDAPARSRQLPDRTAGGSSLSRADRQAIPTRPAAAGRPVAAAAPLARPRIGQRVQVYWHGSKAWHAGVVEAATGQLHFAVRYDTQGKCTENFSSIQWKPAAAQPEGAEGAAVRKSPAATAKRSQPSPQPPPPAAGKKGAAATAAAAKKAAAAEEEEEDEDVVEKILGERTRGGRREYRVQWRDGNSSWEEYSQDYLQSLSVFDSYVASVRLAARQGKTPPQRKNKEDEAVDEDEDEVADGQVERRRKNIPWTEAEVQALRDSIAEHGAGKWAKIKQEGAFLASRTSVDLKDKWRNLRKD